MPGSFDLDNTTPSLCGDALAVGVYLYAPEADDSFFLLPNVRCLRIDYREGPEPPVARFEYVMDDTLAINLGWPSQFEQLWPIDAQGPYVVNPDDRLVVMAQNPDGIPLILFDGFAQVPQVDLTPRSQRVTFTAVGVAAREWDNPISGRVQRNSDPTGLQDTSGDSDVQVDLPCRFNPADTSVGGSRRLSPQPDAGRRGYRHVDRRDLPQPSGVPRPGDRAVAGPAGLLEHQRRDQVPARRIQRIANLHQLPGPRTRSTPSWKSSPRPRTRRTFDPEDAETSPLTIRDYDASNQPYPEAIADLLSYAGFVMRWDTGADGSDLPQHSSSGSIGATAPRRRRSSRSTSMRPGPRRSTPAGTTSRISTWLGTATASSTPGKSRLRRGRSRSASSWPRCTNPAASDAQSSNRKQFFRSSWSATTTATTRRKYRWYGADECGDGHWTQAGTWSAAAVRLLGRVPAGRRRHALLHGAVPARLADLDLPRHRRQPARRGPVDQLRL